MQNSLSRLTGRLRCLEACGRARTRLVFVEGYVETFMSVGFRTEADIQFFYINNQAKAVN